MKDSGPRLLLIDAGVIFFAGARAYLPVPNQRFLLREAETTLTLDALPLEPHGEVPAPEAPLTAARLTHQAVLSLARAVQHVEGDELHRLKRYVVERDGAWVVDTFLQNRDVMLARQMTWHRDKEGVLQGRLSRDVIRFALYAITSGYTMQEATDWLRRERISDMNEAIATARKMGWRVEYLLERARLNYKIFMPEHADFYFNRGVKAFEQGRLEDSLKAFEEASKRDASMVEARYNIGLIHYRMGKYNESNSSFLVAAGHPRVFPDVLFNRAVVSLQKGDKKNALRLLQSYMEGVKKDPEASAWIKRLEATGEKG
ncbi:tetratricopeptide repeat protein [Myxococcota bacterium]|nr:tetratricopeptide repeat protein [Myxococcota bacterium]MBU1432118.1 tetratricopeptide repeat protein [Myxococcota bacterium]MBU1900329.1 tetratricopeptide repeat protein [Myxococcota bacterium]